MPSAAAWPTHASTARRVHKLSLVLAVLSAFAAPAAADEGRAALRVERHDGYDRLVISVPDHPADGEPARPIPLLRRGESGYRLPLPIPLATIPEMPRGLVSFEGERSADGSVRTIHLVPAPGSYLRYRSLAEGFALDVVHGLRTALPATAVPSAPSAGGPLPPRIVHAGLLFSAPRLAALRLGEELILIVPRQSDLDPTTIPPTRVSAVAEGEQGRHRVVRLTLRPDTQIEIARESAHQWRLGFGTDATVVPAKTQFAAEGRSVLIHAGAGGVEPVTMNLPELGPVAVVLAASDWATTAARSPYLDVLDAVIGGVVVPRTDNVAIEQREGGIAVSSVSRPPPR